MGSPTSSSSIPACTAAPRRRLCSSGCRCVCVCACRLGATVTHLSAGQYVPSQLDLGEVSFADGLE